MRRTKWWLSSLALVAACHGAASKQLDAARRAVEKAKLQTIQQATMVYQAQHSACPKSVAELVSSRMITGMPVDPWGHGYVLQCPGTHGSVDVSSPGPDGVAGNGDDINSWEE